MLNEYSPFSKPFRDLAPEDLARLRSTAEGWYIEYKREVPNTRSIAKSVSAFANQFGGWLFYGVQEAMDGSRTAGGFPGISATELPAAEERVRDAVRTMMHPSAHFEIHAVHGPCAELGLNEGRSVLIVRVPEGANSPYIHSSGRIYRRIADSSDPREITDRNALDALVERSQRKQDQLHAVLTESLELSKAEKDIPYCQLYFLPDPLGDQGVFARANFNGFVDEIRRPREDMPALAFDNIFSSASGYVARQVFDNDPHHKVLTWEYRFNGSSIVTVPLRRGLPKDGRIYQQHVPFMALCAPSQIGRVLDLNPLLHLIAGCASTHWRLSNAFGVPMRAWTKARLENVWRCVPFIDTAAFMEFVEQCGLPTVQQDEFFAPPGTSSDSLRFIEYHERESASAAHVRGATIVAMMILSALGIPVSSIGDITEFLEAGVRGTKVAAGSSRHPE